MIRSVNVIETLKSHITMQMWDFIKVFEVSIIAKEKKKKRKTYVEKVSWNVRNGKNNI